MPVAVPDRAAVGIVGGGPAGLTLAVELGRRGVPTVLLEEDDDTSALPQANATQARTMEHFRRLGFADEVRAQGLPAAHPTDVAYFTRYSHRELARFRLPPRAAAADLARAGTGSWSTPELPHRCSQMFIEPVIRRHAARCPSVTLAFGRRVQAVHDEGAQVRVRHAARDGGDARELRCDWLVGCDGPRSLVRRTLGFSLQGEGTRRRHFMGGRMLAVFLRSRALLPAIAGDPAWMYWTFNAERRSFMASIDGDAHWVFHTQLREDEEERAFDRGEVLHLFAQAFGAPAAALPALEPLLWAPWNAGYTLVAEGYGRGRVLVAGDAAHLFTPTGGLGYNTAIDDVCNLGWKLAAAVQGWGSAALVDSYATERRPIGLRNTAIARGFADSIGGIVPAPELEDTGPAGEAARVAAGERLHDHARREFDIPGVTFGVRYDGSPVIADDAAAPPPDALNRYLPSAVPGGRMPHAWLDDGSSLYDRLGAGFTLLALERGVDARPWTSAAATRGVPLSVCALAGTAAGAALREVCEARAVLVRPDQYVVWRDRGLQADPLAVLDRATGRLAG